MSIILFILGGIILFVVLSLLGWEFMGIEVKTCKYYLWVTYLWVIFSIFAWSLL